MKLGSPGSMRRAGRDPNVGAPGPQIVEFRDTGSVAELDNCVPGFGWAAHAAGRARAAKRARQVYDELGITSVANC